MKEVSAREKIQCGSYGCVYVIGPSKVIKIFGSRKDCEKEGEINAMVARVLPESIRNSATLIHADSLKCHHGPVRIKTTRKRHYIVYRKGVEDLWSHLRGKSADPSFILSSIGDVLALLGHMHRNGVYHRDIKPENMMVVGGKRKKRLAIIDFGIATDDVRDNGTGTPGFMHPSYLTHIMQGDYAGVWQGGEWGFVPREIEMLQDLYGDSEDVRDFFYRAYLREGHDLHRIMAKNDMFGLGMTLLWVSRKYASEPLRKLASLLIFEKDSVSEVEL
jgi:serine/threonine protein kinase